MCHVIKMLLIAKFYLKVMSWLFYTLKVHHMLGNMNYNF